jgi:hypothetical protein
MGRGEYKDVCCHITLVLLIAGAAPAYAVFPANRGGDNAMLLITGIVPVVKSVALWKMIQSRKKRVSYEEVVLYISSISADMLSCAD